MLLFDWVSRGLIICKGTEIVPCRFFSIGFQMEQLFAEFLRALKRICVYSKSHLPGQRLRPT